MSTDWHDTDFATGCATYGGLTDEVRELRAQVRQQTQDADRWRARYDAVVALLQQERLTVYRVRTLPRYITEAGNQVVSAAALDQALGGAR